MSTLVNKHRVSVDYGVSVFSSTRIFRRYFIVGHAFIWEHGTDTNLIAIFVRRIMTLSNIAVESRTIIDTQYTVHAAYDAADYAANNRSHGTGIVLTDASAMSSAIWYALSVCSGRHRECHDNGHGANEHNVSNHVSFQFGVKVATTRQNGVRSVLLLPNKCLMIKARPSVALFCFRSNIVWVKRFRTDYPPSSRSYGR